MIILLYDYKKGGKKEGNTTAYHRIVPLKDIFVPYLLPRSFIVVHIGTNVHLFEYKLQRCPCTIVYIFQIVFCVCCMYSIHTVMDTCTFTYYFILF